MIWDLAVFQMTDHLGNYDNEMFFQCEKSCVTMPLNWFQGVITMSSFPVYCIFSPVALTARNRSPCPVPWERRWQDPWGRWVYSTTRDVRTELGIIIIIVMIPSSIFLLICSACKRKRAPLKLLGPIYGWCLINGSVTITLNFNIIINHYPLYTLSMLMLIVVIRYIWSWLETMSTWLYLQWLSSPMIISLCFQQPEPVFETSDELCFKKKASILTIYDVFIMCKWQFCTILMHGMVSYRANT